MKRISEVVPSLYFTDKNDLVRFLEALDVEVDLIESSVQGIANLIDVDKCPDDKLPYLANLVGCPLPGTNPAVILHFNSRQRHFNSRQVYFIKFINLHFNLRQILRKSIKLRIDLRHIESNILKV